MLSKLLIEQVIESQKQRLLSFEKGLLRTNNNFKVLPTFAIIITGIRRCGKSTLLRQIHKSYKLSSIYIDFEDPRIVGFDVSDFNKLSEIAGEKNIHTFFFDEIQNIDKWENFVRFKLDEGDNIFITGSNASMLSKELGTKLTGRHLSSELFPFSYLEFLKLNNKKANKDTSLEYLVMGGFPEYLKNKLPETLMHTFNDIIVRDIANRYNIKNVAILKQLAVWLISNIGKPISGNSIKKIFSIASSSTIMEYLVFFADSYLFFFIPKFSYSHKIQIVNAKKVYSIDTGLINVNSNSFTEDKGRVLENLVFLHLRRKNNEIYYYSNKNECDFVCFSKNKLSGLFQVCWQLNEDNLKRELAGITEAMDFFKETKALIITFNQQDKFIVDNKEIIAIPFYKWAKIV